MAYAEFNKTLTKICFAWRRACTSLIKPLFGIGRIFVFQIIFHKRYPKTWVIPELIDRYRCLYKCILFGDYEILSRDTIYADNDMQIKNSAVILPRKRRVHTNTAATITLLVAIFRFL